MQEKDQPLGLILVDQSGLELADVGCRFDLCQLSPNDNYGPSAVTLPYEK
jgi:hypothetical protein